jgi:hypothetical protein
VLPGLVGMHDHLFYGDIALLSAFSRFTEREMAFAFPRSYLAGGVTTIRTAGAIDPATDLGLKSDHTSAVLLRKMSAERLSFGPKRGQPRSRPTYPLAALRWPRQSTQPANQARRLPAISVPLVLPKQSIWVSTVSNMVSSSIPNSIHRKPQTCVDRGPKLIKSVDGSVGLHWTDDRFWPR